MRSVLDRYSKKTVMEAKAFGVRRMVSLSRRCGKQERLSGLAACVFGNGVRDGSEARET